MPFEKTEDAVVLPLFVKHRLDFDAVEQTLDPAMITRGMLLGAKYKNEEDKFDLLMALSDCDDAGNFSAITLATLHKGTNVLCDHWVGKVHYSRVHPMRGTFKFSQAIGDNFPKETM